MLAILDIMIERNNGYPIEFKINNLTQVANSGRYFPATLSHIIVIRNWSDVELAGHIRTYIETLESKAWRPSSLIELVNALRRVGEDEQIRRSQFKEGIIKLEDLEPSLYEGNKPRIVMVA